MYTKNTPELLGQLSAHGFAIGDTVTITAPNSEWQGETGTITGVASFRGRYAIGVKVDIGNGYPYIITIAPDHLTQ